MIFYRVDLRDHAHVSHGYAFATSLKKAEQIARQFRRDHGQDYVAEIGSFDIAPTRDGILRALNLYASHAENG